MDFKQFYVEAAPKPILMVVDIQPEYEKSFRFSISDFCDWIGQNKSKFSDIVFLYNGHDTLDMIHESDLRMWYIENGLDEDIATTKKFYDKGYAFFRYCMDSGIDEDDVAKLVKFMIANEVYDSRDISEKQLWDHFIKEYDAQDVRDLLETSGDAIHIPELMEFLRRYNNKIVLVGGGQNECLKEVEIALKANGQKYSLLNQWIYEEKIVESPVWDDNNKSMGKKNAFNLKLSTKAYLAAKVESTLVQTVEKNEYIFELWLDKKYKISGSVFIKYKDEIVGQVDFFGKNIPIIQTAYVFEEHQKKGLSTFAYMQLIEHFGILMSGESLTGESGSGGSFNIWKNLSTIYNCYVLSRTWNQDANKYDKSLKRVEKITRDMMSYSYGDTTTTKFIVSKKPLNDGEAENLKEAPAWDDYQKTMGNDEKSSRDQDVVRYDLTKNKGVNVRTMKYGEYRLELWAIPADGRYRIFTFKENEIVGFLAAHEMEIWDFVMPRISVAYVYEQHQRKGLGKLMYELLISKTGGVISDNSLTGEVGAGSFDIWHYLSKNYHAYVIKTGKKPTISAVNTISRDMMGDSSELFMVTKEPLKV